MENTVYTLSAQCRDCYRCLRHCPVKAISMKDGQAFVEQDRCISCGTCVRECPQGAKTYRKEIDRFRKLIRDKQKIAISIAPSFIAYYSFEQISKIIGYLKNFCDYIAETTIGAYFVTKYSFDLVNKTEKSKKNKNSIMLSSACPAVVNYIKKYKPELIGNIIPSVSPMIAHAKHIKETYPSVSVVFIGPCIAKKDEAVLPELSGIVDIVLTFDEFNEWIIENQENIDKVNVDKIDPATFDEFPGGMAGLFPLDGGMIDTNNIVTGNCDMINTHISGIELVKEFADGLHEMTQAGFCEMLFCKEGCINGPGVKWKNNIYKRKKNVVDYVNSSNYKKTVSTDIILPDMKLDIQNNVSFKSCIYTEEEISRVLAKTGKIEKENQLNCQACGYDNCRENAIAVLDGIAEPEMCMPYMRRLAEDTRDRIMETSPNGIVILDKELKIVKMNRAFMEFFLCSESLVGKRISYLIDAGNIEKLFNASNSRIEAVTTYKQYGLTCHEIFYRLNEENAIACIFINVTNLNKNEKQLETIKKQTIQQARQLLEHQIDMAQNLAKMLGESTAKGEEIINKLISLDGEDNG